MDLGLEGRRALITGGSKGIGYAIAHRLALEGCEVVLVARSEAELATAATTIRAASGRAATTLSINLSDRAAAAEIVAAFPKIDILVNNAGAIPAGTLEDVSDAAVRAAWDVKVFGYMDMCRHYFPRMRAQGGGVILNVIGVKGEALDSRYIAGSVGNAALIAFTKALGSTCLEDNIRVLGINPGPVVTDRLRSLLRKRAQDRFGDAERWPEMQAALPGRRGAEVDEIAATAALLCSPLSAYTTGTVLNIDGGIAHRYQVTA